MRHHLPTTSPQVRGSELQTFFTRLVGGGLRTVTKPQHVDLLKRMQVSYSYGRWWSRVVRGAMVVLPAS